MLCGKFGCSGSAEDDFKNSSIHFLSPLAKRAWPFSWIKLKLNSLHPWMPCAKFGWNWPSGFEEEDFLHFLHYSLPSLVYMCSMGL